MGAIFAVTPGGFLNKLGFDIFDDKFQEHLTPRQYIAVKAVSGGIGLYMDQKLLGMLLTPEKVTPVRALKMRSIVRQWTGLGRVLTNPYILAFAAVAAGGYIAAEHGGFDQFVSTDLPAHRNPISPVGILLQDRINTLSR